jgi:Ca2+-dependent lipid-binding protein
VYCIIKVEGCPKKWKTKTIQDNTIPVWDEFEVFDVSNENQVITIGVYDENAGHDDDFYGSCFLSVGELISNYGPLQLELKNGGNGQKLFLTLRGKFVFI